MKNIITAIVFTSMFSHNITCMKRSGTDLEKQLSVKKFKGDEKISSPFLPIDIWGSILIDSLENKSRMDSPQALQANTQNICLINHESHQYISRPDIIRTIIGKASRYASYFRGNFADRMTTPAVQNYVQKSETLNTEIHDLNEEQIRILIQHGADVNFSSFFNPGRYLTNIYPPLLFKTQNDYNKSQLLLELGASPTLSFLNLNGNFAPQRILPKVLLDTLSPLEDAQRQGNIELAKLYSQYLALNDHT